MARRTTTREPRHTDVIIGHNIRIARVALGMSQTALGEAIGVTFQQIQKYEKGTNRVGGSRMVLIARTLGVSIEALYEGAVTAQEGAPSTKQVFAAQTHQEARLLTAYRQSTPEMRTALLHLAEVAGVPAVAT